MSAFNDDHKKYDNNLLADFRVSLHFFFQIKALSDLMWLFYSTFLFSDYLQWNISYPVIIEQSLVDMLTDYLIK